METIALLRHEQTQTTQLTHTACEAEKAEEILRDQFQEVSQSQEQQIKSLQAYNDVLEHKNDELHDKIQKMQEQSESLKRIRAA